MPRRPDAAALPAPFPSAPFAAARRRPGHEKSIADSHARCAVLGLSRIERPEHAPLGSVDLDQVLDRNRRLYSHAAPLMEILHGQIAGTNSMVVLCDAAGTIIHSIGDDDFLARAAKVALKPGVNWSEQAKGTNAIGTALMEEAPMLVHADEHYMHANHFLTCSAAPIWDPRGNVLGVLDVTGDHRGYHQHTMALVCMTARMIENHWMSDHFRAAIRLHFHRRPEFIGTLLEGVLAVSEEGRVVGANHGALELLGLSGAALRLQGVDTLFGVTVAALVDRFRTPLAAPLAVRTPDGQVVHLHARLDAGAHASPVEPDPPGIGPRPAAPDRHALCVDDARVGELARQAARAFDEALPLLIEGETGTGKSALARSLHAAAGLAPDALRVVNCAAGDTAALDELGAFAATAPPRTWLLEEVGALSAEQQAALLHRLQDLEHRAARDGRVPAPMPRLLATSRDALVERVRAGRFREDLFHRLQGLSLALPPLRERRDVEALARHLLGQEQARSPLGIAPETLRRLQAHDWPGNVRQLHNVLRAAALAAGSGTVIEPHHLPAAFVAEAGVPAAEAAAPATVPLEALEREAIERAVAEAGGNISQAARRLGVSRNTIYRRLRWRAADA